MRSRITNEEADRIDAISSEAVALIATRLRKMQCRDLADLNATRITIGMCVMGFMLALVAETKRDPREYLRKVAPDLLASIMGAATLTLDADQGDEIMRSETLGRSEPPGKPH